MPYEVALAKICALHQTSVVHHHKRSHELVSSAKGFMAAALLLLESPALYWNDAALEQDKFLPNLTLQTQRRIPHG